MVALVGTGKLVVEIIVQPISLLLLLIGCCGDTDRRHRIRSMAWGGCALFAGLEILLPMLLLHFEGILPHAALLIVSLLMLHSERGSVKRSNGSDHLYLGRVVAAAGIGNFLLSYVIFLNGTLTFLVALQSVLLPLVMGMKLSLPLIDTMDNSLFFKTQYAPSLLDRSFPQVRVLVPPTDVAVVYECTGIREILFLFFIVAFIRAERQQKRKAFWLAASIVYAANILRNNLVIALYGGGWTSFEIVHSLIGNLLIFLALTSAALVVFFTIPEVPKHLFSVLKPEKAEPR